ncbi:hypothetical protein Tco_0393100 [Tanacetum coccineum]
MRVKWWWLSWWYEGGSGDGVVGDVVVECDGGDERVFVEMVLVTKGSGGDDVDCGIDGVVMDGVMMAAAGVVLAGGWPDSGDGARFNERRGRSEDEHE